MFHTLNWVAGAIAGMCRAFAVTPQSIRGDRRGNLPPPEGGISAF